MKCDTSFQSHHAVELSLQICKRSAGSSTTVVTTVCQFYEVIGKEEAVVGRKRSRSDRFKDFKATFYKENYSSHNRRMHSAKFTEYCELDIGAKKSFFNIGTISGSHATMHAFSSPHSLPLRALINKDIVNIIIGDMMFTPRGHGQDYLSPPSRKLCDDSRFFRGYRRCGQRQLVCHHRQQHQAVSVGCPIFGCWTVVLSGGTGDARHEKATRHLEHWIML